MTPGEIISRIKEIKQVIEEYLDEDRPLELLSESVTLVDRLLYDLGDR